MNKVNRDQSAYMEGFLASSEYQIISFDDNCSNLSVEIENPQITS